MMLALFLLSVAAFPGAEGFGAQTPGGRGGDVYTVTNLNDAGPGSLREGIRSARGPRTIAFAVSGTIELKSRLVIDRPFLTIAGQTAPGGGITLAGWNTVVSGTHDVIVRYLRFRPGDTNCPKIQDDAFTVHQSKDVIVDHVSASWSIDESLSVTHSDRVTVQWSFITESLNRSCHTKGAHGYGTLLRYGNGGITLHHNLYAHHSSRNPRAGDELLVDFVNNVIYNYGSEAGYSGKQEEGITRINYRGNTVLPGPQTPASRRQRAFNGGSVNTHIFQQGNRANGADSGWAMITGEYTRRETPFPAPAINAEDAGSAYRRVLQIAGASRVRDTVDLRIVREVIAGSGKRIDSQKETGGWPVLAAGPAWKDSDGDGMPDEWEQRHGLDPQDPRDGARLAASGYSRLEEYLNELATPVQPPLPVPPPR